MKTKFIRIFFLLFFMAGTLPVALKAHWFFAVMGALLVVALLAEGITLALASPSVQADLAAWRSDSGGTRFGTAPGEKIVIKACLAVVLAVFVLSVRPTGGFHIGHYFNGPLIVRLIPDAYGITGDSNYYPLIAEGFLKGRLDIDIPPHPGLRELADPYDPAQNHPLRTDGKGGVPHDLSYYNNKFYAYWGPVPALLLYIPFELAKVPRQFQGPIAMLAFAFGAFLAQIAILLRMAILPSGRMGGLLFALSAFVLAFANSRYLMLGRTLQYEVAIAGGCFFLAAALYVAFLWLESKRSSAYAVLISLLLGLAFGSRISMAIPAALIMLVLLAVVWVDGGTIGRGKLWASAAIGAPFTIIFAVYLLYNYLRFDEFLQFGNTYVLAGHHPSASLGYPPGKKLAGFLQTLHVYLFAMPEISSAFPYVRPHMYSAERMQELGVAMYWRTMSGFFCYPALWGIPFFAISLLSAWKKKAIAQYGLGTTGFLQIAILASGVAGGVIGLWCIPAWTGRYVGDIDVCLILLGVISCLCFLRRRNDSSHVHSSANTPFVCALIIFIAFCLFSIWTGYANYFLGEWRDWQAIDNH